ncbi:MAG: Type 1 glutamine amidotransferase-like domain-containing protein [Patescibacteria group bacterium]|jgi:peptidase E
MSTKYILVGGYPKVASDGGKAFCEEMVNGFAEPVKILDCLFARPKETWEKALEDDKMFLARNLTGKEFVLETAELEKFSRQARWADVIYLRGGDEEGTLIEYLSRDGSWLNELDGKVLVGTSAGSDAISKYFYDLDNLKLAEGLGILQIKIIVHYQSNYNSPNIDWDRAYEELKNYEEDLPIITLKEGEYKIF